MQSQVGLGKHLTIKVSGGDGIPVELFQILKDDAVKVLPSICQEIWKTQQWYRTRKGRFSFYSQRKAMSKNVQTTASGIRVADKSHPPIFCDNFLCKDKITVRQKN